MRARYRHRQLDELEQDVLHVLAHITGLGKRGGVGDGKRHLEDARERLGKQGLTGTGGTEQQNVGLGELHLVHIVVELRVRAVVIGRKRSAALNHAAVVVVHGNRHGALGIFLAHDIGRKLVINLVRRRHMRNDLAGIVLELKASASGSTAGCPAAWP